MHELFRQVLSQPFFAKRPTCRVADPLDERHIKDLAAKLAQHRDEISAVILEPIALGADGLWLYAPA